jgi:membrane-bound serine protease (ClpP class)
LLYIDAWLLAVIIIVLAAFLYVSIVWGVRAHKKKVEAGKEGLVGETAVAETTLEPKGVVIVEGEHWTAIVDEGRVEPEEEVIITKVDGLKLMVTKKQQEIKKEVNK